MFLDHPLFGVGIGHSKAMAPNYLPPGAIAHWYISAEEPHNIFLNVATELGVFCVLLFVALFVMALVSLREALAVPATRPYAIAVLAALTGVTVTFLFNPLPREVWITLALSMALGRVARAARRSGPGEDERAATPNQP
jgi:O-antigen ligase